MLDHVAAYLKTTAFARHWSLMPASSTRYLLISCRAYRLLSDGCTSGSLSRSPSPVLRVRQIRPERLQGLPQVLFDVYFEDVLLVHVEGALSVRRRQWFLSDTETTLALRHLLLQHLKIPHTISQYASKSMAIANDGEGT